MTDRLLKEINGRTTNSSLAEESRGNPATQYLLKLKPCGKGRFEH
jgi:hypothetical protein